MVVIKALEHTYQLKGVGNPEYYLGGDVRTSGNHVTLGANTYIGRVIKKIEETTGETIITNDCR